MKKYPMYDVDYYNTFPEMVNGLKKQGDKPALEWYGRNNERFNRSYSELQKDIDSMRKALIHNGMTGKHVAIVGENSYQWIVSFLAITSAGAVAVCVDIEQSDETIRELIKQADSVMVMVSQTFYQICLPLLKTKEVDALCLLGEEAAEDNMSFYGLIKLGESLADFKEPGIDPDDTAAIMFTSGTTSRSKPVMLTHRNLLLNASNSIAMVETFDHSFTSLPLYHSYGLTCSVNCMLIKGTKITINGDMKTMIRDLMQSNPTAILAVPLMAEAIYKVLMMSIEKMGEGEQVRNILKRQQKFKKFGFKTEDSTLRSLKEKVFPRLKIIITGGAHLDPQLAYNLKAFGILVLEGYGITECSPLIAVNRNEYYNIGTVGTILPGCELKIENGEIWIKGPNTMKGYYKDPESTAEIFEGEWFKTGDLGSIDKNGFLTITGRIKNLIVLKNGKKISPEKIEELIKKIPMVKDVLVYGVTSGNSADDVKPAASIHPNPEYVQGMSSYEILETLQKEINKINVTLPLYQQIQMVNIREKEFAKTSSKKIKRYAL